MTEERPLFYSSLADDEDLKEIIGLFVEEMSERTARFEKALASQNWDELKTIAHQFKGAAGSHGFSELSIAARELEERIKSEASVEDIAAAVNKLVDMCGRATARPKP